MAATIDGGKRLDIRGVARAFDTDLRFVLRRLAKAPGFAMATLLMLGLGVALGVGMFSVVGGVLLGALPYPDSARVVVVGAANAVEGVEDGLLTPAEVVQLEELQQAGKGPFDGFGYYSWGGLTVFDGERPRELATVKLSAGVLPALGVAPLHGRWFNADDYGKASDALILSESEWRRLFGADPAAIGRSVRTDDGVFRVVGIMPAGFATPGANVGAWRPIEPWGDGASQPWFWNARFMNAYARLPQQGAARVQDGLDAIGEGIRERYSLPAGWNMQVTPVLDTIVGNVRVPVWGALAIALLVLLIGCANVVILLDARETGRRHAQALLQALGASRARMRRILLLETVVLSFAGVGIGLLLAWLGVDALRTLAAGSLPRVEAIVLDARAVGFALLLAPVMPLVALLAGSLRPRASAAEAIRGSGRGLVEGRAPASRRWLPAVGVALSTVSLVAACALVLSLVRLQQVDPGFRTENVHGLQMWRSGGPKAWLPFAREMEDRLRALPGVEDVAMTTATPLSPFGNFAIDLQVQGRAQPEPYQVALRRVTPDYLQLLDIPLLQGRGIQATDGEGAEPVAVISRTLAERAFPDGVAVGQVIGLPLGRDARVMYRVVGVAEDVRNDTLRSAPIPEVLVSFANAPWVGMTFLVRTGRDLPGVQAQMAAAVWDIDPLEGITRQFALAGDVDAQLQAARFFARTVGAFALAALLLAAFAVYAVAALQQQRRVGEFGLRLAIGARPAMLAVQILRESMAGVLVGIGLGALGALAVLRLLQAHLFGLQGGSLGVLAAGAAALAAAALVASMLPAWRATRVDPGTSLRCA